MSNVAILWDKPSDGATFSGGSWVSGLPLDNLKSTDVQEVARSTSASTAHTRFRVDLGTTRPSMLSMFGLLNHNGTTSAKWRIVVTNDASDADPAQRQLDTGLMKLWVPTVVFGSMPWGMFPWDGVDPAAYPGGTIAFYIAEKPVFGRYIWVYIEDAANPAGYFQAGRFLAGQAWSPETNVSYGASIQWVDPSEVSRTRGGRRIVVERPRYRIFRLRFETLTKAEAFGQAFEIDRQLGVSGDFLLVLDPEESGEVRFRQTIYAAKAENAPIEATYFENWEWSLLAEELI